jgi:hypothetical protein
VYNKLNAEKFKAQGKKVKELNAKSYKALMTLKNAKEKIQKKYAEDDPVDFGKGPLTSADKANAIVDAKAKDTNWGTWGASGTPGKKKFYTDGVISSNAYRTPQGNYILGLSRRRIGAGFGRRRRFGMPAGSGSAGGSAALMAPFILKHEIKKAEKGHDLLKAMGKVKVPGTAASTTSQSDIIKAMDPAAAKAYKAMMHATKDIGAPKTPAAKKKAAKKAAAKKELPPGVKEAEKAFVSPKDREELKASGAGVNAEVDKNGHFERITDDKIIGKKETAALTKGEKEQDWTEDEVMELIQDAFEGSDFD